MKHEADILQDLHDAIQGRSAASGEVRTAKVSLKPMPATLRQMVDEQAGADPERLPWPERWWTERDSGDYRACRELWAASLLHCLRAALGLESYNDSYLGKGTMVGIGWIGSRDFHMVCALAGLDGSAVEYRLKTVAEDPAALAALMQRPGRRAE